MSRAHSPLRVPAPSWAPPLSDYLLLWHGCTSQDATGVKASGINLALSRPTTDFGKGFYTTLSEDQGKSWAWERYYRLPFGMRRGMHPVTIRLRVPRDGLASLKFLAFVRGERGNDDLWSLIQHCRQGLPPADHRFPGLGGFYDVVVGPVSMSWRQKIAMPDGDQMSFHTARAVQLLDNCRNSGRPDDFKVEAV